MRANPLLDPSPWPAFSEIRPEHVEPAVESAIVAHQAAMAAIRANVRPDFDNVFYAKELAEVRLNWAWWPAQHLEAVANRPPLREVCQAARARLTAYRTGVAQDPDLFAAIEAVEREQKGLEPAQRRAVALAARGFRLSGVTLPADRQRRFSEIQVALGRLSSAFSNAVLDATDSWSKPLLDAGALAGLPPAERRILRAAAEARGQEGWLVTLQMPVVQAIMTYADDRVLREKVYRAYQTRASDEGPDAGRFDNGDRIAEILALRREAAQLLGFESYAERSLFVKMAGNVETATTFLTNLATQARPFAEAELSQLRGFAKQLGIAKLQAWDVGYVSEKLRRAQYAVDQAELRQYFQLPTVLQGLFELIETLYGIKVVEQSELDVWNPDVRYFAIRREGAMVAGFYLDPFARQGKRGGAWMAPCRPRLAVDGGVPAISYVVCNFSPPAVDQPTLLTHGEVVTLFHETGHCLHHLLSEVELPSIAGVSGFEWDAVEWPSQLMENFAWEPEVLNRISSHVESGAPLPTEVIERLARARTFQSGLGLLRQIEFALFDLRLHQVPNSDRSTATEVLDAVRAEVAVMHPPRWTRFPSAFTHVFAGSYAAGYYSYLWAERLSADAFEQFVPDGRIDPEAGDRFRREVLAAGAARPAIESFIAFRGRPPENGPLLRQRGLS